MPAQNKEAYFKVTIKPTRTQVRGAVPQRKSGYRFQKPGFWAGKTTHNSPQLRNPVANQLANKSNTFEKTQRGLSEYQCLQWNDLECAWLSA